MNQKEREALEKAGFAFGDAEEFLGLTDEERRMVDLRVTLGRTIQVLRELRNLTRPQFARRLRARTSHVAAIELGVDVSLDEMFGALFALGGTLEDIRTGKPVIEIVMEEPGAGPPGKRKSG